MGNKINNEKKICLCQQKLHELLSENSQHLETQEKLIFENKSLKDQLARESEIGRDATLTNVNRDVLRCVATASDLAIHKDEINTRKKEITQLKLALLAEQRKVANFNQQALKNSDSNELNSNILIVYFINTINEIIPTLKLSASISNLDKNAIISAVTDFTNNAIVGVPVESKCSLENLKNESNEVFIASVYYYLVEFYMSISIFSEN
jgi:hypothetical protein